MIGRICWYTFILVTFGWFNKAGSDTINTRFLYSKYKEFAKLGDETPLPHAAFTNAVLCIDGISRASKSKKNQPATYLIDWPSVHVSLA